MSTNPTSGVAFAALGADEGPDCSGDLPPIVRIVLTQAMRYRMSGAITEAMFAAQVRRLEREELDPRGLRLQTRHLSRGGTRFLVRSKTTGTVRYMVECASD